MANPKATVMGIGAAPFVKGRLTPEQADQVAAAFRPSWEVGEVSFSPDATLSDADMRALEASAANGQTASASVQNGHSQAHAPPPRVSVSEPEDSVIIDRSITADQLAGASAAPHAPAQVVALHDASHAQAQNGPLNQTLPLNATQPLQRESAGIVRAPVAAAPMQVAPMQRAPAMAVAQPRRPIADDDIAPPKKSKMGLFVGLGIAAAAVVGVGIAVAMSGGEKSPAASTDSTTTATQKEKSIPPPPPATAAAPTPTAATPATTATTAAAPTTPPAQTAKPQETAAAATPPKPKNQGGGGGGGSYPAAPPAPKPPPPKAGGNIVRDVPF